jgi:hypothetical protein
LTNKKKYDIMKIEKFRGKKFCSEELELTEDVSLYIEREQGRQGQEGKQEQGPERGKEVVRKQASKKGGSMKDLVESFIQPTTPTIYTPTTTTPTHTIPDTSPMQSTTDTIPAPAPTPEDINYGINTTKYDPAVLSQAVTAYLTTKNISIDKIADKYKIKRDTLYYHIAKKKLSSYKQLLNASVSSRVNSIIDRQTNEITEKNADVLKQIASYLLDTTLLSLPKHREIAMKGKNNQKVQLEAIKDALDRVMGKQSQDISKMEVYNTYIESVKVATEPKAEVEKQI